MAKQLMIYERAVPISIEKHKDWSVKTGGDFSFARDINSVPLLAAEFPVAALEHTIIFAGEGDAVFPSVILGIGGSRNDHVKADGSWTGNYVPAFLRRYPFVFSKSEDGQTFTLCIDEEYEGFNNEGLGERLFDAEGKRTQYTETMLKFIQEYQVQFAHPGVCPQAQRARSAGARQGRIPEGRDQVAAAGLQDGEPPEAQGARRGDAEVARRDRRAGAVLSAPAVAQQHHSDGPPRRRRKRQRRLSLRW